MEVHCLFWVESSIEDGKIVCVIPGGEEIEVLSVSGLIAGREDGGSSETAAGGSPHVGGEEIGGGSV